MRQLLLLSFLLLTLAGFSQNTQYLGSPKVTINVRGQVQIDTLKAETDTTNFKPLAANAAGLLKRLDRWPGSGSSLTDSTIAASLSFYRDGDTLRPIFLGDTLAGIYIGGGQNLANTDLSQTGDRNYNGKGYNLRMDSLYAFFLKTRYAPDFGQKYALLNVSPEEGATLGYGDGATGDISQINVQKDSAQILAPLLHVRATPYLHTLDSTTAIAGLGVDANGKVVKTAVGGGSTPGLQAVTDVSATTTNNIRANSFKGVEYKFDVGGTIEGVMASDYITGFRTWFMPDAPGTFALTVRKNGVDFPADNNGVIDIGDIATPAADSINTPQNMLWQDAVGNFHKAAVPSGSSTTITNNLTTSTTGTALDAAQGKVLKDSSAQQRTDLNTAYGKRITAAAFSGSATKTLTLTRADGSTVTASFTDSTGSGGTTYTAGTDIGSLSGGTINVTSTLSSVMGRGATTTTTYTNNNTASGVTDWIGQPSNYGTDYTTRGVADRFYRTWNVFTGVNASGRPNVVPTWLAYNSTGSGRINTSEAAYNFNAETHYEMLSDDYFEIHNPEVTTKTGTTYRPFSIYASKTTPGNTFIQSLTGGLELYSAAGNSGGYFSANGSNTTGAWRIDMKSPKLSGGFPVSGFKFYGDTTSSITNWEFFGTSPSLQITGLTALTLPNTITTKNILSSSANGLYVNDKFNINRTGTTASLLFNNDGVTNTPAGLITNFSSGEVQLKAGSGGYFTTIYSNGSELMRLQGTNVGIGTAAQAVASAKLEVKSTTQGVILSRMTTTNRDAISSPAKGLIVTDTTVNQVSTYNGTNWTGSVAVSSAATLTLTHGSDYIFTGTTTTWTLPAVSSSIVGRQNGIMIKNRGSGAITLNSASGSTLYTTSAQSSITIAAGAACYLLPDGTYFNVQYNQ